MCQPQVLLGGILHAVTNRFPEAAALPKVHGHRGLALVKDQRDQARPLAQPTFGFAVIKDINCQSKDCVIAFDLHMKGYLDVSWNKTNIAVP